MRIDEFNPKTKLIPGQIRGYIDKVSQVAPWIKIHCSEFLNASGQTPLYRGIDKQKQLPHLKKIKQGIFIGNSRIDRKPVCSDPDAQDAIDAHLIASGLNAVRSNSIFCSGRRTQAQLYGSIYYIFPLNGFTFTWNPDISDLFTCWPVSLSKVEYLNSDFTPGKKRGKLLADIYDEPNSKFAVTYGFKNTDLYKAIKSLKEIYIHGKYIAINEDLINAPDYSTIFYGDK